MRRRAAILRVAVALGTALGLGGCGFAPVYGTSGGVNRAAVEELSAISVPVMPERSGMLMRQALQDRLQRFGSKPAARYELNAPFAFAGDIAGVDANTNVTRLRYSGSSNWILTDTTTHAVVTHGLARAVSGADVFDSQFFANEQESDVIQARMTGILADQIVTALASYFDTPTSPAADAAR